MTTLKTKGRKYAMFMDDEGVPCLKRWNSKHKIWITFEFMGWKDPEVNPADKIIEILSKQYVRME